MKLISEARTKEIAYYLTQLACSAEDVLYREDHPFEMELISNAKSDVIARCLEFCAEDIDFARIEGKGKFPPTHKEDMILISKAKDDKMAEELTKLACSKDIWKHKDHQLEMNLIYNAKTITIEQALFGLASSHIQYKTNLYLFLLDLISNAKTDTIVACLCINTSRYYDSEGSYRYESVLKEFYKLISKAKSERIARCLSSIANDNTTYIHPPKSIIHREAMKYIANAKSDEEAMALEEETFKFIHCPSSLEDYKDKMEEVKKNFKKLNIKKLVLIPKKKLHKIIMK